MHIVGYRGKPPFSLLLLVEIVEFIPQPTPEDSQFGAAVVVRRAHENKHSKHQVVLCSS
jgi:hypothetical protein